MNQARKFLFIIVILFLCMVLGSSFVYGSPIRKPVIYSYYWPVAKGQKDLLQWHMITPTIIDVPWQDNNPKWQEARVYWEKKDKTILHRIKPFTDRVKWFKTDDEMYTHFSKNIEKAKGIAIDELVLKTLTKKGGARFVNVLKRTRSAYPDKIIAVWCAGDWRPENAFVLRAIRDYADILLSESYISQKDAAKNGIGKFKLYVTYAEALAPGITKKLVMGLGMYPKMKDDPSKSFTDHLAAQITLLGTDPLFKDILGIALYAPVYNTAEDQKRIDTVINKYFNR